MSENITIRNCTFAFKCEAKWDCLEILEFDNIRFCNICQKEVYFCHDDEDLAKGIRLNRCIAFFKPTEIPSIPEATMGTPTFPLPKEFYIEKLVGLGLQENTLQGLDYEELLHIWGLLDNSAEIDEVD